MSTDPVVDVPGHLIDGAWTGPGDDLVATNPAHPAEEVSRAPAADAATVAAAVAAAWSAQAAWAATPAPQRGEVLHRVADRLTADGGLARLITREQGKTLAEATGEVTRAVQTLRFHAERARAPEGETYAAAAGHEVRTLRVPVGVVAAITPWNFPLAIPVWKLAPMLVHGNAAVWKPAEQTPAVAARLARAFADAGLPAGVLGMVLGGGDVGAALTDHADLDAITFTGSVPVGRGLLARAAPRGVRVQCELGGHNPAVVLDDADLDHAAEHIVAGAMASAGQKCTATRRVLVDAGVHDALVERLLARCDKLVVGDGLDPASDLGPVIDAAARDRAVAAVADAAEAGCRVLAGGDALTEARYDGGHYVAPTLVAVPAELSQMPRLWHEEVFGPVTAVRAVDGVEEAFAAANDTAYGLSAAVHTASLARARVAAAVLDAGMITINGPTTGAELHAPFGGLKASTGPGPREQGPAVRDFVTTTKTVTVHDPGT